MLFEQDIAMRTKTCCRRRNRSGWFKPSGPGRVPARGYIGKPSTGLVPNWWVGVRACSNQTRRQRAANSLRY